MVVKGGSVFVADALSLTGCIESHHLKQPVCGLFLFGWQKKHMASTLQNSSHMM